MATSTTLKVGGHSSVLPSNTLDYSESGDDILDNFADGPDDGVPMGVGGERGKQSEPASSTLESDIVHGTTKQPGEKTLPETPADGSDPAPEPAGETSPEGASGKETPEEIPGEVSEEPGIPPLLLQMAGYADADAAKADGLGTPEALNAYIRGRGKLLASEPATDSTVVAPYGQPRQPKPETTKTEPASTESAEATSEFKPFELSDDDRNNLDEQLISTIDRMNSHNQSQFEAQEKRLRDFQGSLSEREEASLQWQAEQDVRAFDKAVQGLGGDWKDLFGEGDFVELSHRGQTDPASRMALEYRRELFDTVQTIREVSAKRGFSEMDLQSEIGFGLMQRFPDKFHNSLSKSSEPQGGTERTSLNRPTQRKSPSAQQDALLDRLNKKFPKGGFTATDPEGFDGEI